MGVFVGVCGLFILRFCQFLSPNSVALQNVFELRHLEALTTVKLQAFLEIVVTLLHPFLFQMCRGLKSSLHELLHLRKGICYKNGLFTADLDSNPVLAIEFLTEDLANISMRKHEGVFANCVCTISTSV